MLQNTKYCVTEKLEPCTKRLNAVKNYSASRIRNIIEKSLRSLPESLIPDNVNLNCPANDVQPEEAPVANIPASISVDMDECLRDIIKEVLRMEAERRDDIAQASSTAADVGNVDITNPVTLDQATISTNSGSSSTSSVPQLVQSQSSSGYSGNSSSSLQLVEASASSSTVGNDGAVGPLSQIQLIPGNDGNNGETSSRLAGAVGPVFQIQQLAIPGNDGNNGGTNCSSFAQASTSNAGNIAKNGSKM